MTQEEKQLLLTDLCARLPYGVIVDYKENEFETPHWKITTIYPNTFNGWIGYDERVGAGSESGSRPFNIGEVKPYLRPMSSMTEEEKKEYNIFFEEYAPDDRWPHLTKNFVEEELVSELIDWLNKKMFDFRGLIPKDLALSTDEYNPYKN